MAQAVAAPEGLHLVGRFLTSRQEEDRPNPAGGTYPGRFKLTVLVNDRTFDVEYRTAAEAELALGEDPRTLANLTPVALSVGVRSAKGFTFYFGK